MQRHIALHERFGSVRHFWAAEGRICRRCGESPTDTPTGHLCAACRHTGQQFCGFRPKVRRVAIVDALRTDPSLTHADTARRFGISRERVRQIAKQELGETGTERRWKNPAIAATKAQTRQRFVRSRRTSGKRWLSRCVNRWLAETGCFYCSICHGAVNIKLRTKGGSGGRCKPCTAKQTARYNAQEKARDPEAYRAKVRANNQKQAERLRLQKTEQKAVDVSCPNTD